MGGGASYLKEDQDLSHHVNWWPTATWDTINVAIVSVRSTTHGVLCNIMVPVCLRIPSLGQIYIFFNSKSIKNFQWRTVGIKHTWSLYQFISVVLRTWLPIDVTNNMYRCCEESPSSFVRRVYTMIVYQGNLNEPMREVLMSFRGSTFRALWECDCISQ